ncbi:MAG: glycogen debranching protein [Cyanobacteria bacterium RI_101]|nr:glycogen debranching protein [Cyanobacteria bacterium RI_101]
MTTIWVNEQLDPQGIVYACIACLDESAAQDCHRNWLENLTEAQKQEGWSASLRSVESWDEVPVNALKISF